jgi:hypothetical protein
VVAAAEWNSLEIVKLLVAGLTPLVVAGLTFYVTRAVNRAAGRVEEVQAASRRVIERRLKLRTPAPTTWSTVMTSTTS